MKSLIQIPISFFVFLFLFLSHSAKADDFSGSSDLCTTLATKLESAPTISSAELAPDVKCAPEKTTGEGDDPIAVSCDYVEVAPDKLAEVKSINPKTRIETIASLKEKAFSEGLTDAESTQLTQLKAEESAKIVAEEKAAAKKVAAQRAPASIFDSKNKADSSSAREGGKLASQETAAGTEEDAKKIELAKKSRDDRIKQETALTAKALAKENTYFNALKDRATEFGRSSAEGLNNLGERTGSAAYEALHPSESAGSKAEAKSKANEASTTGWQKVKNTAVAVKDGIRGAVVETGTAIGETAAQVVLKEKKWDEALVEGADKVMTVANPVYSPAKKLSGGCQGDACGDAVLEVGKETLKVGAGLAAGKVAEHLVKGATAGRNLAGQSQVKALTYKYSAKGLEKAAEKGGEKAAEKIIETVSGAGE